MTKYNCYINNQNLSLKTTCKIVIKILSTFLFWFVFIKQIFRDFLFFGIRKTIISIQSILVLNKKNGFIFILRQTHASVFVFTAVIFFNTYFVSAECYTDFSGIKKKFVLRMSCVFVFDLYLFFNE